MEAIITIAFYFFFFRFNVLYCIRCLEIFRAEVLNLGSLCKNRLKRAHKAPEDILKFFLEFTNFFFLENNW